MSWKLGKSERRHDQDEAGVEDKADRVQSISKELKESSFLGGHHHSSHKDSSATITPSDSRSTTPTPAAQAQNNVPSHVFAQSRTNSGTATPTSSQPPTARSGLLKIRVTSGKSLKLPDGGQWRCCLAVGTTGYHCAEIVLYIVFSVCARTHSEGSQHSRPSGIHVHLCQRSRDASQTPIRCP